MQHGVKTLTSLHEYTKDNVLPETGPVPIMSR